MQPACRLACQLSYERALIENVDHSHKKSPILQLIGTRVRPLGTLHPNTLQTSHVDGNGSTRISTSLRHLSCQQRTSSSLNLRVCFEMNERMRRKRVLDTVMFSFTLSLLHYRFSFPEIYEVGMGRVRRGSCLI